MNVDNLPPLPTADEEEVLQRYVFVYGTDSSNTQNAVLGAEKIRRDQQQAAAAASAGAASS